MRNLLIAGVAAALFTAAHEAPAAEEAGVLEISVVQKETGKAAPCRIHLIDPAGKPVKAGDLPFFRDHFTCPGSVKLELWPGKYRCEVERGPEFSRHDSVVTVARGSTEKLKVELARLADLAAEGWWCADLHVHRPAKDVELLMRAEDLHVAPVITWWNNRNQWASERNLPEKLLVRFDETRYYHLMAGEDEREGGALLYFNLPAPLAITGASREYPSPLKFLHEARKQKGLWVDIEKPFWWDVPLWLADGQVDSIGIANNHMCRAEMRDAEAWGKPRDLERFPSPTGNGYWTQEIYYQVLNSGLRIPPSAGSASGVLPNPVGYNRVYVQVEQPFSYERFWEGLKAGRAFVTNGPLLRCKADGHSPGHVFTVPEGKELSLDFKINLTSREPIRAVELIRNGKVEQSVPFAEWKKSGLKPVTFKESGWFLVRAIVDDPKLFRFASTGPFYVEGGGAPRRISKAAARFFLDWVNEREKRVKLTDAEERKAVLAHHEQARKYWQGVLDRANAD
jgi:hypothetical protein